MDHASRHGDGVLEYFVGDAELLEGVDSARGEREIDRSPADKVAFARVSSSFVKIDIVSAPSQIGRQQSAGQTGTD